MTDPLDESIFGAPAPSGDGAPAPSGDDDDAGAGAVTRRQRRTGHRSARHHRGRVTLAVVAAVLVIAAVFAVANFKPLYDEWSAPKDYAGEGTGTVTVVVNPGDSGQTIARTLESAGVIKTEGAFTDALDSSQGDEVQPGTYSLRKEMKAGVALSLLRGGGRDVAKVTIREGLWKAEVYDALAKGTGTPRAEYDKVNATSVADPALLGLPPEAKGNPEGWLFPATYSFDRNTTAAAQIKMMVAQTRQKLTEASVPTKTAQRVLILASLVEAEARHVADGPKVARVLSNRLSAKPPMKLQLDSTSMYGVQRRTGKAFSTEQMRAAKNAYNTYVIDGLPLGPIGNPGLEGIKAALNPAPGPWQYFVTINPQTGETVFTSSLAEHDVQVAKLNAWCLTNQGSC